MARTGSGKTAAFVIPIVDRLKSHSETVGARALILSPTRDLALQTLKFIKLITKDSGLRSILVVGGESMAAQFSDMALNPDIIVATPGRLLHHIIEVGISFKRLEVLVFDEADRMFEMGFADQISAISKTLRAERQTMLFSATLPTMVYEFARAGLNDPKLIRLDKNVTLPPNLELGFFLCTTEQKIAALMYLFKFVIGEGQTIVFCATRHSAQFVKVVCLFVFVNSWLLFG
jgi:ATP-dependent RNA helicase DDX54/DBP10